MFWHNSRQKFFCLLLSCLLFLAFVPPAYALPQEKTAGKIESVASFNGAMPTGVTVSQEGRIFVNFPRWGDKVDYTVAEVVKAKAVAYPNAKFNRPQKDQSKSLVSVQSVVVDPLDR